jgi:hypothetical protein
MNERLRYALHQLRLSGLAQSLDVRLQEAAGRQLKPLIDDNYISPPATITFPHSSVPLFRLLSRPFTQSNLTSGATGMPYSTAMRSCGLGSKVIAWCTTVDVIEYLLAGPVWPARGGSSER